MAVGTFTIKELNRVGAVDVETEDGETFEWTSDRTAADPTRGGARACPRESWTVGGMLRTARTDYPGARTPSEQVLGPHHKPFTLTGRWDDRYNFPGYAVREMRRFEALCRRGNVCRMQFQNQVFDVLIKDWDFTYRREWYIPYKFSVSTHDRPDDVQTTDRSPTTLMTTQESADELDVIVGALLDAQSAGPAAEIQTALRDTVDASLADLVVTNDAIADTIDAREFEVSGTSTVSPFKRLATQFRTAASEALDVTDDLVSARSDVELGIRTALAVLNFEDWSRSLRFQARVIMGSASSAASDLEERDDGAAISFYRPFKGESLYRVSRRFYGTPFAWRLIADRNALTEISLTGEELLIIPERGEG